MKRLAVDIGNSKVAVAALSTGRVIDRFQDDLPEDRDATAEVATVMARIYDWCADQVALAGDEEFQGVGVSCVVPSLRDVWRHLWDGKEATQELECLVIDADTPFPFEVAIEGPETVGADRYCNVAAAVARGHVSALVVDLGTANTYDVLRDGVFRGGLIGPGFASAHRALIERGAQLPAVPFAPPPVLVGRHTVEAMQSGSFQQAVGAVRHVVATLRPVVSPGPVLLTGGMAPLLAQELEAELIYCPDLTLEGAASLLEASSAP